jgi:hypothetical protein
MSILEQLRKNAETLHRTLVSKRSFFNEVAFLARVVD